MLPDQTPAPLKNVLMLHSVSDIYGASRILLITATMLLEMNYNVHVVISEQGPLSEQLRLAGVRVSIIRLGILRKKYFNLFGLANRAWVLSIAYVKLRRLVKAEAVGVIYSNTAMVLVGGFLAKATGIKHLWHIHEITEKPKFFARFLGWAINRNSDRAVTVSAEVSNHWGQYVQPEKLVTIHNGLDYSPYVNAESTLKASLGITDSQVLVGMVGRVNSWKGHRYFVDLAAIITERFTNVKFVMVGDAYKGEEHLVDELIGYVSDKGLSDHISYLGFRADIPNVLKGLDVFVLPSILPDPLPTTVLEAMACGIPVVATRHGGAKEMVDDGVTGMLIPWDDAETAVSCFSDLFTDQSLRKKMGQAGLHRVLEIFSRERYFKEIMQAIDTL